MFGLGWGEIAIILVVAVFLLGPERIPTVVQWVVTNLRKARTYAAGAQDQLRSQLGPELEELRRQIADLQSLKEVQDLRSLRDLNPRNIITKNVLGEEFSGGVGGFLGLNKSDRAGGVAGFLGLNEAVKPVPAPWEGSPPVPDAQPAGAVVSFDKQVVTPPAPTAPGSPSAVPPGFDPDAT